MRTIYSPYRNQKQSGSHPVKKERESLSSQTLETCPTWATTDSDSLMLNQTFSHEVENDDPIAPKSTTKERKRWIEDTLLKKGYTPYNTPAREEYCRNRSQHELTAERKRWIENTLLTNEPKSYNTKTREEYCKNKDNHELTTDRKRWIEETLLTKTNMLPSTPPNKRLKSDPEVMKKEAAACEIVVEMPVPIAQRRRQFDGPAEIDAELMRKLQQRAEDEDAMQIEDEYQRIAEEEARQHQRRAEEEEERQNQRKAEEEARQRQRMTEEARQRQLVAQKEARQLQLMAEEEATLMEQERIREEAKLAEEAIAALQQRLNEEMLKRERLEEEARLANAARLEEHKRYVELAENTKIFETRIEALERQEEQRNKMRAYIATLREEKKLREDELAIVEELEKDNEGEEDGGDDEDAAAEYERYLSNYRSMSERISTMGANNIFAMSHPNNEEADDQRQKRDDAGARIGVQLDMPRRTPMVIRSVGSFTDFNDIKKATVSVKKHKKRIKLLEKLVKLLSRNKSYDH